MHFHVQDWEPLGNKHLCPSLYASWVQAFPSISKRCSYRLGLKCSFPKRSQASLSVHGECTNLETLGNYKLFCSGKSYDYLKLDCRITVSLSLANNAQHSTSYIKLQMYYNVYHVHHHMHDGTHMAVCIYMVQRVVPALGRWSINS